MGPRTKFYYIKFFSYEVKKVLLGKIWYIHIRVIPKKANIQYINFGDKYDLQIQIVAIFRKKDF